MTLKTSNRERVRQRKRERRRQASEAQCEKERKIARARDKKQRRHFLLEDQHENFVAAVKTLELLAATKVKISGSKKKVKKNMYDISSIKVSRCSRAKQRQRIVQKSVLHVQSCFFAN